MRLVKFLVPTTVGLLATRLLFGTLSYESSSPDEMLTDIIKRQEIVEASYRRYQERLDDYHSALRKALKESGSESAYWAPDRKTRAGGDDPRPTLISGKRTAVADLDSARIYSWPATEDLIAAEVDAINELDADLRSADALDSRARRAVYQRLTARYEDLRKAQQSVAAYVEYNRFWQRLIATHRPEYDRQTSFYAKILSRDRLNGFTSTLGRIATVRVAVVGNPLASSFSHLAKELKERAKSLADEIQNETEALEPASFIRIEQRDGNQWIVHVPFSTDIADRRFIASFKTAIENIWHVRDGNNEYGVELTFATLPPGGIRGGTLRSVDSADLDRRLASFDGKTALLTSGGITTYAQGPAIILGPEPVSTKVLAHEFGHVLGFRDAYVRGYRDLGRDGVEVMEADADPQDIMAAPETGRVLPSHFSRLFRTLVGPRARSGGAEPVILLNSE